MANTWNKNPEPNRVDPRYPKALVPYTYKASGESHSHGTDEEWLVSTDTTLSATDADPTSEPYCAKVSNADNDKETDMYCSIFGRYETQTTTTEFFITPCFYNRWTAIWYKGAKIKIVNTPTEDYGQVANIEMPAGTTWLKLEVTGLGASDVVGIVAVPRNNWRRV
jgi:hypothetical protein